MDKHKAKELARIHEVIHKKWVKKQKERSRRIIKQKA